MQRHRRVSLAIVLAAGLYAGAPAGASGAAAKGGVQVTINGQPGPRLATETLSGNEGPRQITTIRDSSGQRSTDSVGGTPAATLVQLVGIDPASVQQLEVIHPSGGETVLLETAEIVDGFDGDPKGTRFATFDAGSGSGVSFFRPLRSADDANNRDRFSASINEDLKVNLFTDAPPLNVTASADRMRSSAGKDVFFRARSDGNRRHFYFWDFGDGTVGDGPDPAHTFAAAGTYDVTVTVTSPNGSSGVAGPLRIRVGKARTGGTATTPGATTAPGGGSGGSGTGGGRQSSGGGSGGADAPSSGPAQGAQGSEGSSASRTARRRARQKRAAAREAERAKTAAEAEAMPTPAPAKADPDTVRGRLVADSSVVGAEALAAAEALARLPDPSRTAARAAAGNDSSPLVQAAGGALLLVLLVAGAMREGLRPSRRLLLPT